MRRLILLCLFGLLITGAVAVASPVLGRPAATTWFAAAAHVRKASAHRSVKPEKRDSSLVHTPVGRAASAASSAVLFGEQSIESGRGWDSSGHAQAFPFTNTSTGSATSINVYLRYANRATTLVAGLYATKGGHAGALVAVGSVTSPKAGAWNSVPVRSAPVTPGTYWVAVLGTGGGLSFRQGPTGSCNSQMSSSSDLEALPSTWAGGTTENGCPISAYVAGTLTPASAGSGTTTTTAPPTGPVTLPPVNTGAPAISGGAVDGDTLTSSNGSWADSPTSYAYQWQDCTTGSLGLLCTNISGATDSSYALTESDVGDTVRVLVTAGNSAGSTSAASAETAVVTLPPAPANTAAPVVTGSPAQGQTLSTGNGTWSNSPTSYSYAWQDCDSSGSNCTDISNASASTYTLTSSDVGHTIRSVVTASNAGGSNSASSAQTAAVTSATPAAPTNTAVPAISGTAQQGQTLTASNGSWSGSPTSYGYQWRDCTSSTSCTNISGATSSSYTLQSSDVGKTVDVVVTATNAGGSSSASSAQTAAVTGATPAAPANTAVPTVSGTAQQGDTLTASNGSWSGSPTSYAYRWQDCASSTSCTNISGASSSTYTLQSSDVGDTIDVVVTASNASGSGSASSGQTAAVTSSGSSDPPPGQLTCNLNATTSNFTTQIADATPGQVVCLASGDYSSFSGTSKSAPGITITAAPGATVTFNSGMNLNLSSVQNFTLDGTGGGGTMTVGGELNLSTSGGLQNKALNLTFQNIAFTSSSNAVLIEGPENSNIVFDRDTFIDGNAACNGGSPSTDGAQFMLDYGTSGGTTPSGVTLENSVFVAPGDLWNPNRAMETVGSPLSIENNVFAGFLDHTESASCNHIDTLQLYAGSNSTDGNVTFTGNLCYDDYNCFAAWDGTSDNTITDNACFDIEQNCIDLYSDTGSVINHNTQQTGGADPSGCGYLPNTQGCNSSTLLENSNKSGDRTTTSETYTNNLDQHGPNVESGSLTTNTNNMWSGASSPNINGTATFTGGSDPLSWTGFELTSGSTGHNGGNDGQNVGIRASAGGPPTGGGSAPANTAAPSLTGTGTEGDTLTTTNGTWTITGNVPTTTTYQWWDCSTSTFSTGSCTPIQPQTAPTSANNPTYTLQSSDVGKYIFSEVTTTNANGQINATSKPIGPIAS
jgi:hypothetical protein